MSKPAARDSQRILVVEDECLIGLCLAEELEALGFEVVGPFATCAEASAWLSSNTPDMAALDILLRGGPCLEIARELRRRRVPMLFFTALWDWPPLRDEFAGTPVIRKPIVVTELTSAFAGLLGREIEVHALAS